MGASSSRTRETFSGCRYLHLSLFGAEPPVVYPSSWPHSTSVLKYGEWGSSQNSVIRQQSLAESESRPS